SSGSRGTRCASASRRRRTWPCTAKRFTSASAAARATKASASPTRARGAEDLPHGWRLRYPSPPVVQRIRAARRAFRRLAREAEGAPLLREYGVKSSIEG